MAYNSDEVNLLVYRYLEESGFRHSAYTFGYESNVLNAGIDGTGIPRGALLSLLQKGVLFAEAEVFSLLNDAELDARFEKAIGCMTILECAMCDSIKMKALQRRVGGLCGQQQQRLQQPSSSMAHSAEEQQQIASRTTPTVVMGNVEQQQSVTHQQQQNWAVLAAQGLSRPDSTSSVKSSSSHHPPPPPSQQLHREREIRAQQSTSHSVGTFSSRTNYRSSTDRLGTEQLLTKCNPTNASTSTTGAIATCSSIPATTVNHHLHPNTAAVLNHPYYQLAKQSHHNHLSDPNSAALLATNISNGAGVNGPVPTTIQITNTGATFPNTLSGLHHQNPSGGSMKPETCPPDLTRFITNGTFHLTAAASAGTLSGQATKRGLGTGNG